MSRDHKNYGKYQRQNGRLRFERWVMIGLSVICVFLVLLLIGMLFKINWDKNTEQPTVPTDSFIQSPSVTTTPEKPEETTEPERETTEPSKTTDPTETTQKETEPKETEPKETEPKETEPKETEPKETEPKETEPKETEPRETEPKETEPKETEPKETEPKETEAPETNPPATQPAVKPTEPPETEPVKTVIQLPYTIPGTNLVIQRVASYDGVYLEDGSDVDASSVAMMLLKNSGSEAVEYANITMVYDDKTLTFTVSALGAGDRVVVQAANRSNCAAGDLIQCTADVATRASLEMSQSMVSVVDNGDNSLTIKNLTDKDIVTVRIFYKYYMTDEDVFVGGITYTAKISNLKAGESITVTPSHYSSEASTVVMIRTYDTDA